MTGKEILLKEIERLSESNNDKILDFIRSLKGDGLREEFNGAIASESALQKDWSRPEEDQAWQSL